MSFAGFPDQQQVVQLLQRSLDRGRLAHAYLFTGDDLASLEAMAAALARTLVCAEPIRGHAKGPAIDACDRCLPCRKVSSGGHPDVHWVRPESKSRQVTIEQIRELLAVVNLKPTEAAFKVAMIAGADRLTQQAGNAFLKTLEEPPARSILVLLSTEPHRIIETLLSRCLRLNFVGTTQAGRDTARTAWRATFAEAVVAGKTGILDRYGLLSRLLAELTRLKGQVETELTDRSPLQKYDDLDPKLRERWEEELEAAVEGDYRRVRAELLGSLQEWLHDVWVRTTGLPGVLARLPGLDDATSRLAARLSPREARENLGVLETAIKLLNTNVQESLVLEVAMLKLRL